MSNPALKPIAEPDMPLAGDSEPTPTEIVLAGLRRSRRQLARNTEQLERIKREDSEPPAPSQR